MASTQQSLWREEGSHTREEPEREEEEEEEDEEEEEEEGEGEEEGEEGEEDRAERLCRAEAVSPPTLFSMTMKGTRPGMPRPTELHLVSASSVRCRFLWPRLELGEFELDPLPPPPPPPPPKDSRCRPAASLILLPVSYTHLTLPTRRTV